MFLLKMVGIVLVLLVVINVCLVLTIHNATIMTPHGQVFDEMRFLSRINTGLMGAGILFLWAAWRERKRSKS